MLSLLIFIGEGVRDAFDPRRAMAADDEASAPAARAASEAGAGAGDG